MINKIGINQAVFRAQSSVPANTVTNPQKSEIKASGDFYVDKKTADAIKSYNFVADPAQITKPIGMDDYIEKLKRGGLKEGKDFDVKKTENNGAIFIYRGEKLYKSVLWHDGHGKDNYAAYEDFTYPINTDITQVCERYDRNGIKTEICKTYKNPDAHKDLMPKDLNIDTKPEEYIANLKKQNKNYEINREQDNNGSYTSVYEIASDGTYEKIINFYEGKDYKSVGFSDTPDGKGNLTRGVDILKSRDFYEMNVSEYVKDLGLKNTIKY